MLVYHIFEFIMDDKQKLPYKKKNSMLTHAVSAQCHIQHHHYNEARCKSDCRQVAVAAL